MQWNEVIAGLHFLDRSGREDIGIRGIHYDSRRIGAGDVFVAMRGGSTDGNRFIDAAIQRGAAAILTDSPERFRELREQQPELALALAEYGRRALAEASSVIFGEPQKSLGVTAITGTNGKTTTAFLTEQLLRAAGRQCLLMGTVETRIAGQSRPSEHTTPESRDIVAVMAEAVRKGCTEAVMEMSSHALEQERVWGIPVDVAVFTNLTQDHLDYHHTMAEYAQAKARLFAGVGAPPPRVAVINQDDPYASEMVDAYPGERLMRYSVDTPYGTHRALSVQPAALGSTRFLFATPEATVPIRSPLSGSVNVYNLLAAMCAALARGVSLEQIAAATPNLQQAPGRFEVVPGSHQAGFTVVVDYAHTHDALANLLRLARETVGPHRGQVITLFGCGGDRDRTKRPKMGRAAGADSDLVILTSDNPRGEDPTAIIDETLLGVQETRTTYIVEPDRRAAIEIAIRQAKPGDIVLLAGKGHEKVQIFADHEEPFDDVAEAARILQQLNKERNP